MAFIYNASTGTLLESVETTQYDPLSDSTADTVTSTADAAADAADTTPPVQINDDNSFVPSPMGVDPYDPMDSMRKRIASWADDHWDGSDNGYKNDCTDFASRAIHIGGGRKEHWASGLAFIFTTKRSIKWWYRVRDIYGFHADSHTWNNAEYNLKYEVRTKGDPLEHYSGGAVRGDLIYANWGPPRQDKTGIAGISHMGIVHSVHGDNPYVTQHTEKRHAEPVWKIRRLQTWQAYGPKVSIWIAHITHA